MLKTGCSPGSPATLLVARSGLLLAVLLVCFGFCLLIIGLVLGGVSHATVTCCPLVVLAALCLVELVILVAGLVLCKLDYAASRLLICQNFWNDRVRDFCLLPCLVLWLELDRLGNSLREVHPGRHSGICVPCLLVSRDRAGVR